MALVKCFPTNSEIKHFSPIWRRKRILYLTTKVGPNYDAQHGISFSRHI